MPPIRAALCAALASLVLATASAPLLAQDRDAMRQACGPDVARLCPGVKPGGGRILACFKEKAADLSPGCRSALQQAQAQR
ncbi:MAG TPA: cysteine rich repeat-containing protein [Bosea sp. (in: a-proteobacteria)]|uniref:cysteine rich repeat-containing protein n=1 Tax=Bosea sp. (in: a-proteobacteria) TaxID=1871050 RepID=UPI002DDD0435|nr:cysteine rich repeat-containing protein [Bosea sp. (in: a-proteobacteria)]HEV2554663.1 cysteine rich repeat-containing protein [Bosea sp. (in: a-proteobacteria)]